jgi:hypothetical protein
MATIEPNFAYRRYPWLAARAVRKAGDARYRRSLNLARVNTSVNSFFAVVNLATGKAALLVMMVPAIAHAGHKWWHLRNHPDRFHAKDRRLREVYGGYCDDVACGQWAGPDPVPLRVLVAPAVALNFVLMYPLLLHRAVVEGLVVGVAAGVLWFVGATLSIELAIGTEQTTDEPEVYIDLTEIDLTDAPTPQVRVTV